MFGKMMMATAFKEANITRQNVWVSAAESKIAKLYRQDEWVPCQEAQNEWVSVAQINRKLNRKSQDVWVPGYKMRKTSGYLSLNKNE